MFRINMQHITHQIEQKEDVSEKFELIKKAEEISKLPISQALSSLTTEDIDALLPVIESMIDIETRHDIQMMMRKCSEVLQNCQTVSRFVGVF